MAQPQIIGIYEIDEASVAGFPDQRVDSTDVDMIGNHRDIAWIKPCPDRTHRRCQQHFPRTEKGHRFQCAGHYVRITMFVEVRAPLQIGDANPLLNADRELPLVSSRPEEFHPRALPEPCMNLSIHTAPDVRPLP